MGYLIEGRWTDEDPPETGQGGQFQRIASSFRGRISRDGSTEFPAEAGRYHLYVGYHCPWAHRTIIYRALKGLEDAISISYCLPAFRENGWTYEKRPEYPDCTADEINGFHYLYEAYAAADPGYTGKVTIPVLWDKRTRKIVNNESSEIIRMLNTEFVGVAGNDEDFYPEPLRAEIDALNELIYPNLNNGVYRAGFARTQAAYEEAYRALFARLDWLSERLATRRYLVGDTITEADVQLWPTLVRFDAVYHGHFKCNRNKLTEMPVLWAYARDLFQTPGFGDTIDFQQTKEHYYKVHTGLNPSKIVPAGPDLSGWTTPHHREELGGRPFGDGTAPGPPPPQEGVTTGPGVTATS